VYEKFEPTLVMYYDLRKQKSASPTPAVEITDRDIWLRLYHSFSGTKPADRQKHTQIIQRMDSPLFFIIRDNSEKTASCGVAVVQGELMGLFDLVTAPVYRGQGFGKRLVMGMLNRAARDHCHYVYLQVVDKNQRAVSLYKGIGFRSLYQYAYWKQAERF
jgi:ribosomal protein S18 acetylase RimI-like enzyme